MGRGRGRNLSDQAAADRAAEQGEVPGVRMARHPRLYAIEPAADSGKGGYQLVDCPMIFFSSRAPVCDACGAEVRWCGPPERRAGPETEGVASIYAYEVTCACPAPATEEEVRRCIELFGGGYRQLRDGRLIDVIEVDFPLRMGGTAAWWLARDWVA